MLSVVRETDGSPALSIHDVEIPVSASVARECDVLIVGAVDRHDVISGIARQPGYGFTLDAFDIDIRSVAVLRTCVQQILAREVDGWIEIGTFARKRNLFDAFERRKLPGKTADAIHLAEESEPTVFLRPFGIHRRIAMSSGVGDVGIEARFGCVTPDSRAGGSR